MIAAEKEEFEARRQQQLTLIHTQAQREREREGAGVGGGGGGSGRPHLQTEEEMIVGEDLARDTGGRMGRGRGRTLLGRFFAYVCVCVCCVIFFQYIE